MVSFILDTVVVLLRICSGDTVSPVVIVLSALLVRVDTSVLVVDD